MMTMLGVAITASAQQEVKQDGFLKKAFRDMKESAKLQRQIDRANFQAVKLETKAFYEEQKRRSNPSVRTAAERENAKRAGGSEQEGRGSSYKSEKRKKVTP